MKKILVATDFSPIATAALRFAAKLAKQMHAELIALYADRFEPPAEFTTHQVAAVAGTLSASQQRAADELERCVAQNVAADVQTHAVVLEAPPVTAVVSYAKQNGVDLIVVGTHARKGLDRFLLGSVAEKIIANSPVPVIVVPPKALAS